MEINEQEAFGAWAAKRLGITLGPEDTISVESRIFEGGSCETCAYIYEGFKVDIVTKQNLNETIYSRRKPKPDREGIRHYNTEIECSFTEALKEVFKMLNERLKKVEK